MHLLYYGSEQEKMLHWQRTLKLLKDESEKMGKEYDSPESKQHIIPFIQSFQLESTLDEMIEPDPNAYPTFNAFFAREIREAARPIAEPENDLVTSSPADCRLTAFPTVDLATKYWIKGYGFTLERLLGDADLASQFEGGSLVIARLAPQDYHRWHAPVSGTVRGVKEIPGAYYSELNVPSYSAHCPRTKLLDISLEQEIHSPFLELQRRLLAIQAFVVLMR
jgi:phosphatidylserine decarboxylase